MPIHITCSTCSATSVGLVVEVETGGGRGLLDSKTVENGGWAGLLGSGGGAGELLCHGVELEALGAGDGSLFHVEGPGADLEEKTGGTGVETLAGWFV